MTRSERLGKLAEHIEIERSCSVGGTGYIDDHVHPEARMTKGQDKWGRVFVTLCVRSFGQDDRSEQGTAGVITVFQRFAPGVKDDIVVQACNTWRAPRLFLGGSATDKDMELVEKLVLSGEASRTVENVLGGTLHERLYLISPEEAVMAEWGHRRMG
jgi:hypothetical protein